MTEFEDEQGEQVAVCSLYTNGSNNNDHNNETITNGSSKQTEEETVPGDKEEELLRQTDDNGTPIVSGNSRGVSRHRLLLKIDPSSFALTASRKVPTTPTTATKNTTPTTTTITNSTTITTTPKKKSKKNNKKSSKKNNKTKKSSTTRPNDHNSDSEYEVNDSSSHLSTQELEEGNVLQPPVTDESTLVVTDDAQQADGTLMMDDDESVDNTNRDNNNNNKKKIHKSKHTSCSDDDDADYEDDEGANNIDGDDDEDDHDFELEDKGGGRARSASLSKTQNSKNKSDMPCCICRENITNKWHSVWITPQNVKQYKECFKDVGYDGSLGRACRTCYNRFFSFTHAKKYSNVVCICCTKPLSKRSYPFASFAEVYRSLFPNIDPDASDGRVCTTCYDKGYNARQGISKPPTSGSKRGRPPSTPSAISSPKRPRRNTQTPLPNANTVTINNNHVDDTSSDASIASTKTTIPPTRTNEAVSTELAIVPVIQPEPKLPPIEAKPSITPTSKSETFIVESRMKSEEENESDKEEYMPRRHRRRYPNNDSNNSSAAPPTTNQLSVVETIPIQFEISLPGCTRRYRTERNIRPDISFDDLKIIAKSMYNSLCGCPQDHITMFLLEKDRFGLEIEVAMTQRSYRKFPLTRNTKIRVIIPASISNKSSPALASFSHAIHPYFSHMHTYGSTTN